MGWNNHVLSVSYTYISNANIFTVATFLVKLVGGGVVHKGGALEHESFI